MAIDLDVQVKIPFLARFQPAHLETVTRQTIYPAMEDATSLLLREVKMRTPVGATEAARGSIQSAVMMLRGRTVEVRGEVKSALPYVAGPLEHGSRPHWAPIGPIRLWCQRVLGDAGAAYAVRGAIAKRGTKARWMFRDGYAFSKGKIERILQQGVAAWARRIRG